METLRNLRLASLRRRKGFADAFFGPRPAGIAASCRSDLALARRVFPGVKTLKKQRAKPYLSSPKGLFGAASGAGSALSRVATPVAFDQQP